MKRIKLTVKITPVEIFTDFIRLDNFLKFAAIVLSGGEAKEAVQAGQVKVNGEVCTMRGKKLVPGDKVFFDGKMLEVVKA